MKRKEFLKKALLGGVATAIAPQILRSTSTTSTKSTYDKLMNQVGFNHLPNKNIKKMNTVIHKANTRGDANHGWLKSKHTFSFANYYNPERMNFGVLRVLNDDIVAAGNGFGTHPHVNMEIVSIPLAGNLEHKDSMGNVAVIKEGDVQAMSAGTGVTHSEYNQSKEKQVKFLQIWIFPNKKNVTPRYDQVSIKDIKKENEFYQIVSPNKGEAGVWINQDAWFHLGDLKKGKTDTYSIKKKENGVYAFILKGDATINGQKLNERDGFGIWDIDKLHVTADSDSEILLMEVPMKL